MQPTPTYHGFNEHGGDYADLMMVIRTSEAASLEDLCLRLGLNQTSVAYMLAERCRRGRLAKREDGTYSLTEQGAQLGELMETVAYCERMWRLQDRLDAGDAARRGVPSQLDG